MSTVGEAWARIHRWLGKHAPKILASLNPGASSPEIATAERALGMRMPLDWRNLYQTHNGMNHTDNRGSLFHGMAFLPLEKVVTNHTQNATSKRELGSDYTPVAVQTVNPEIQRQDIHNGGWTPFAHDWGETFLCVDLAPATEGRRGQVLFIDHTYAVAILLAPSVSQFLLGFIDDLENGRYFLKPEAISDGNEFLDCDPEIDLVNWWASPRWRHLKR